MTYFQSFQCSVFSPYGIGGSAFGSGFVCFSVQCIAWLALARSAEDTQTQCRLPAMPLRHANRFLLHFRPFVDTTKA